MKALVFGGGGSKGAYEVGVWQALDELGMQFDIVCGTSIGAMMGALYVQQDYEKAYHLWDTLQVDNVMVNGLDFDFDIERMMSQKGKYKAFLGSYIQHKGADISPFEQMVQELFDEQKFFSSAIDYGCMTVNVSKRKAHPITKAQMTMEDAKDFIIASASCYPAFPMKDICGEKYVDGGYVDNVPITLARSMGATEVVAVDLKSVGRLMVDEPQEGLTYIEPMVPLGSFLLFDHDVMKRNMRLGYLDTMKKFNRFAGCIYTFPLADQCYIEQMEDVLEDGFKTLKQELDLTEANIVKEKLTTRQLIHGLQAYHPYDHPYLAIIEQLALAYEIDVLKIHDFHTFLHEIIQMATTYIPSITQSTLDLHVIQETLSLLRDHRLQELVNYQYYHLTKEQKNMKVIQLLATLTNDSFILAFALSLLTREINTTNTECTFPVEENFAS